MFLYGCLCNQRNIQCPGSSVQSLASSVQRPESRVQRPEPSVQSPGSRVQEFRYAFCFTLQYKICQKSLRNWVATLCDKIIMYLPFYLPPSYLISLLPQDLWPPYLTGWWVKLKDYHQQNQVTLSLESHVFLVMWDTWQMKNVMFPIPRSLWLLNLTGR